MISLHAGCKINLGLRILGRRPDGYHEIRTLFYPISCIEDELEIERVEGDQLHLECPGLECAERDNLVWKAWDNFSKASGIRCGLHVKLWKRIPAGGGLGGGSSDAACLLRWLNRDSLLGQKDLHELAARIGADVPFFLGHTPRMADGIGEKLQTVNFVGNGRYIVIVNDGLCISTRWAFAAWDKLCQNNLTKMISANTEVISADAIDLENDLEKPVSMRWPQIAQIKAELLRLGAEKAAMSGSGSTMYGIFASADQARHASRALASRYSLVAWQPMRNFGMSPSG